MANQLEIRSTFDIDAWLVSARVTTTSDADFPRSVFLWTLQDDGSLGDFQAIGHADQVAKYPEYDSTRTNNFGIRLVRFTESAKRLTTEEEKDRHITVLKSAFRLLLESFEAESEVITEVYP